MLLLTALPVSAQTAAAVPSITDPRYFAGANVPWLNWGCDFGCSGTGVASQASQATLSDGFNRLKVAGIHTVRWWTFEGDATQIARDNSGAPTGLNPAVYADFDAALALAAKYDLTYDFVLFSGPTAPPRAWLTDPAQRQRLADALSPLFERYKNNPHILAWEFFNEPEFDIWNGKISADAVQQTVKLLASTVHAHTSNEVTVGSASLEGVPLWTGLGLDFYSPHWYDPMSSGLQCARCLDVQTLKSTYGFDSLPIVLGEFYGGPDTDTPQRLKDFRAKGYAGAWAWSLFYDQTGDKMRIDLNAFSGFLSSNTAQAVATPAPAAVGQPSVQLLANWVSPTYVLPGQSVTIYQDTLSNRNTNFVLNFEVDDGQGQRVLQSTLDNQALSAQQVTSFSATIAIPNSLQPGEYVVRTTASGVDGTQYSSSDSVGQFVVAVPPPAPTSASTTDDVPDPQSGDAGG